MGKRASPMTQQVKNSPDDARDAGDAGSVPGPGRSPGAGWGLATHSSVLAWKIPQTEESGGLQSMGFAKSRP